MSRFPQAWPVSERHRPVAVLLVSLVVLLLACAVALTRGAVSISLSDVVLFLTGGESPTLGETQRTILWQLRAPRILAAACVGAALSVAGVGLQALFRNPLADPFIIGASSGASLGVTVYVAFGLSAGLLGALGMSTTALIGSLAAVVVVYGIAGAGRSHVSPATLLLAGIALTSIINAVVSVLMFVRAERVLVIFSWLMGSFSGATWSEVGLGAGAAGIAIVGMWWLTRPLDAMLLGEPVAESLGMDTARYRLLVVVTASVGTGVAVATAGIIGFIGLIAPHIGRMLVGARHVWLIPISALIGAAVLVVSDTLARTVVAPAELPVGILTALLGGPFFLWLLHSKRVLADAGATG